PHGRGLRHERMSAGAGAECLKQQRRHEWLSVKQPAPQNTKAPRRSREEERGGTFCASTRRKAAGPGASITTSTGKRRGFLAAATTRHAAFILASLDGTGRSFD